MTVIVKRPYDAEEKEKIFAFLYEIWAGELRRDSPDMDHDARIMCDELDEWGKHFLAVDETGKVVGCMRCNHFSDGIPGAEMDMKLDLANLFELFGKDKVTLTSRLAVEPAARGRTVTSQLFFAGYRDVLAAGTEAVVCCAALHLVQLYYQIGFRPYAPSCRLPMGVRVPLVLCVRDRAYLQGIKSPLASLLPPEMDDDGRAAGLLKNKFTRFENPGFDRHSAKLLWAQLAHIHSEDDEPGEVGLFKGIESRELNGAMVKLTRLTFDADEILVQRNEDESCMGVLLSGRLGIGMINDGKPRFVSIIKPGEPFGELGGFGFSKRPLDIIALEKSEVVLLPINSLERFNAMGGAVGTRLAGNLLRILAKRVHAGQQTIAALIDGSAHEIRIRRKSIPDVPQAHEGERRVESYGFDTLKDQDSEYERLVLQATVAEAVEFSKLIQIGMKDGSTIVDLGSGPGVISLLLAKYFPNSRVIGVEPDPVLRTRAMSAAESRGRRRCTFIEGVAEKVPLEENSVDFCYARMLFQHLPNPLAALWEMHRITKPGGLIAVLDVDDDTIITHPEIPGWSRVQGMAAEIQKKNGGNRRIGRELLGLMLNAEIDGAHVEAIPLTTRELSGPLFYRLVFGFKRQILERAGVWNEELQQVFRQAEATLSAPSTFAMTVAVLVHGRASSARTSHMIS